MMEIHQGVCGNRDVVEYIYILAVVEALSS